MASVSQVTSLRTNINSYGGRVISMRGLGSGISERVTSSNLGGFGDNSIDKFYRDLSETYQYRNAGMCKTSSGIIEEYITKFRTNSSDYVTISVDGKEIEESAKINSLLKAINFEKEFFDDKLNEYVLFGSELILAKVPKSGEITKATNVAIKFPFSSIVRESGAKTEIYVNGEKLDLNPDEDYFYLPIRIGKLDLQLEETQGGLTSNSTDSTIVDTQWRASQPLFYGLNTELKLFILKDILTKLIQLQDIVAPNLLLTNVDKNTSEEKAIELSEEIEKLINQYGDLTQLISSNADINTISQFILNNVRVYPDLMGAINGTNKFDFTRLVGRGNEIRQDQSENEAQLINSIGIPIDLYRGQAANKFDALRQSDRLLARVTSEMHSIDTSLTKFCIDYLKSIGKYTGKEVVESNLFDYSFIEGINSSYKYEAQSQHIRNISQLAKDIKDTLDDTKDIFKTGDLYKYMLNRAELIYPGFKDLIREDFLDQLNKTEDEQDQLPNYTE